MPCFTHGVYLPLAIDFLGGANLSLGELLAKLQKSLARFRIVFYLAQGGEALDGRLEGGHEKGSIEERISDCRWLIASFATETELILCIRVFGERGWTRTIDPCLKRALLCQLSYAPTLFKSNIFQRRFIGTRCDLTHLPVCVCRSDTTAPPRRCRAAWRSNCCRPRRRSLMVLRPSHFWRRSSSFAPRDRW